MEREISRVFLDNEENIYLLDEKNILYYYEHGQCFPFRSLMTDIKKCFRIDENFYVHNKNTINAFHNGLKQIKFEHEDMATGIDDIDYCGQLDIIVTLINKKVTIYGHISDSFFTSINDYEFPGSYKFIKIVDKLLLLYNNGCINVYDLDRNLYISDMMNDFVISINICEDIFSKIYCFSDESYIFGLTDGNSLSFDGEIIENDLINGIANSSNNIYRLNKVYLVCDGQYLFCYHTTETYKTIIEPLLEILSVDKITIDDPHENFTLIPLNPTNGVQIVQNKDCQIIVCNKKAYLIKNKLVPLVITDENIYYDNINNGFVDKINFLRVFSETNADTIQIDVNTKDNVMDQLLHIIPKIYRLNSNKNYLFEQVDILGNTISHGIGVTRHVFNLLKKDLENVLKNKFNNFDNTYDIGKLLYFCTREGNETFNYIDPYFFYLLTDESNYPILLRKFKGDQYSIQLQRYLKYKQDPTELIDLDLGPKTANEFIGFLMGSNLTPEQKKKYEDFVKGYSYFEERNRMAKIIKKLPVTYYIKLLVPSTYFNAQLYYKKENDAISGEQLKKFKIIFKKLFNEITPEQKLIFLQNVTGSEFYSDDVGIILAYDANQDKKLVYEISTCNTTLTINTEPTIENIRNILNMLVIEDLSIKN